MIKQISIFSIIILLIAALLYTNRSIFVEPKRASSEFVLLKISKTNKTIIDSAVHRRGNIAAIQVVSIHFRRNVRLETFISIDNVPLQEIYDNYVSSKVVETPLFGTDSRDNKRLLRLINGEFVCIPYSESTAYKYAPAASLLIKHVCAIGIPPHKYTEFSGIFTMYLREIPTKDEIDQLFLFSRDLSLNIYEDNK